MSFPALPYLTLPGLQAGGGTCDYPSEDDVRDGVQFDFGNFTGNLILPAEGDVLEGIGYGSLGAEFTGTLAPCPEPPTPVRPSSTSSPFAAIAHAVKLRLVLMTGLPAEYCMAVANDKYKVTVAEDFFLYIQFFKVEQPREGNLDYTNSGAGRLATPVGRRIRVYVYTRSGEDVYGDDTIALFGSDPAQTFDTPPTYPGQIVAEEVVFNALNNWTPLSSGDAPEKLTIEPLHPLDSSEYPERPPEDEAGLLRSCLDFEAVYNLAIDPTEPTG